MKARFAILLGTILLLSLVLQACGGTPAAPATTAPQQPVEQASPTPEKPADTATQPPAAPTATTPAEPTQVQHVVRPGTPSYIVPQTISDCVEGETYSPNKPVFIIKPCDLIETGLVERPASQDLNTYYPYLDIVRAQFGATKDWYYARIVVFNAVAPSGDGDLYYMLKLDLAADGRNSNVILISVKNLPLTAAGWTTDGVQAWKDDNGTITQVFGDGVSSDPDLLWARRSPKTIEFAFKPDLISNTTRFAWYAWAYQGTMIPTDLTLGGGSLDYYMLDATCAFGFNITSLDPSLITNRCMK
jgi:hypothetical protein